MKTIDLKEIGVVELSSDEMKQIEGGSILAALIWGICVGISIYKWTHQE